MLLGLTYLGLRYKVRVGGACFLLEVLLYNAFNAPSGQVVFRFRPFFGVGDGCSCNLLSGGSLGKGSSLRRASTFDAVRR